MTGHWTTLAQTTAIANPQCSPCGILRIFAIMAIGTVGLLHKAISLMLASDLYMRDMSVLNRIERTRYG